MKKIAFIITILIVIHQAYGQQPVRWEYSATKLNGNAYEIKIKAILSEGWHIYSQQQPDDAFAIPTTIEYIQSSHYTLNGKTREIGILQKHKDPVVGLEANRYGDRVDFIQLIQRKTNSEQKIEAKITFQLCTEDKCMMPETVSLEIPFSS